MKYDPDTHEGPRRSDAVEVRYDGRYLGLHERSGWEFATRTNATGVVVVLAVTADEEIVLVEQYRVPVDCRVIELPAGLVGDEGDRHEDPADAAARELWEETGYRAGSLTRLTRCPSSAGLTDEVLTFYLARDCRREGAGGGDGSEDITVHTVPLARVDQWLATAQASGFAFDPKVYTALYWLERRPELASLLPGADDLPPGGQP